MLRMRRLTYTFVLAAGLLALTRNSVLACSGFTVSFWDAFTSATAIFTGKIINIEPLPMYDGVKVTFHVLKSWKGPKDEYLVVKTAGGVTACGIPFEDRLHGGTDTYLIYAFGDDDNLDTHAFSRTAPLSAAGADILKLNIISHALLVLLSVAAGLAISGSVFYFLRRRQLA